MKYPNTVDRNTLKAYIDPKVVRRHKPQDGLNSLDLKWNVNSPESLQILSIEALAESWTINPVYSEVPFDVERNYLLDILSLDFPVADLSAKIQEDVFWERFFMSRWPQCCPQTRDRPWIKVFMEKYLAEKLENLRSDDYEEERLVQLLELCAPHVENLIVNQLQPSMASVESEHNDHVVPLNIVLSNLQELRKIDLTFDLKNVGTNFFLGCANISANDIKKLSEGLAKCFELQDFRLHSSKLDAQMLKQLAVALDKGCPNLEVLSFPHCRCGDAGLVAFVEALGSDSFPNIHTLILTNNFLTFDGILNLATVIKRRKIQKLDLRLNPIKANGASGIFGILKDIPIRELNLSCCSLDNSMSFMLLKIVEECKSLERLNLSVNRFTHELGEQITEIIPRNTNLLEFDLRNTEVSTISRMIIDDYVLKNQLRKNSQ
ncbi:dynein regulatory complex subunit 5 [Phlebotomus argentipes]|uniref:dynein regulatory complex subunit 5 n=1 Tax=Phlebotomus argentipes TaxID=94469 RepID=UPI00289381D3|nr:dynein regulatory complex subunit 5 [Phlebotomus argentipes]